MADRHEPTGAVDLVAPFDPGIPDGRAVALDDEDVAIEIAIGQVRVVGRHALDGDDLLDPGFVAFHLIGRDHARVVRRPAEPPEPEAGDGRPIGDLDLVGERVHHRSFPYFWSMWRLLSRWIWRQRFASAARARGSSRRSAKASSRSSLR